MKVFKRLAAVISAVVIAVSATASMAVTAGTDSIADTAKAISSGKSVTTFCHQKITRQTIRSSYPEVVH